MMTHVILGRFKANDATEQNWISHEIAEWKIHKDYDAKKKIADIALIITEKPVQFTNFIQPICLPSAYQAVVKLSGFAVGYGKVDYYGDNAELPKESHLKTIDFNSCKRVQEFSQYLSPQNFCANGTGENLCKGKNCLKNQKKICLFKFFRRSRFCFCG